MRFTFPPYGSLRLTARQLLSKNSPPWLLHLFPIFGSSYGSDSILTFTKPFPPSPLSKILLDIIAYFWHHNNQVSLMARASHLGN